MTLDELVAWLRMRRFPLNTEGELQLAMAGEFKACGIVFEREVRLTPGDVVDFMIGAIAIEAKVGGSKRSIFRQCERYCASPRVESLILFSAAAVGWPQEIKGKPVRYINSGTAWL